VRCPRVPNLQQETVAAASVEWRRHLHKGLDDSAPKYFHIAQRSAILRGALGPDFNFD
jgi:hypothetical protein